MQIEDFLFYSFISALIFIVYSFVNKGNKKVLELNPDGSGLLRMHAFYRVIGYLALLMTLILSIGILLNEEDAILIVFFCWLIFGGMGVYLLMWYYKHEVSFDNDQIQVHSYLGKSQELKWSEIEEVVFSPLSGLLKMKGKGKVLKLHQHLLGLSTLLDVMEKQTPFSKTELNFPY